jgi:hypothetical protein
MGIGNGKARELDAQGATMRKMISCIQILDVGAEVDGRALR